MRSIPSETRRRLHLYNLMLLRRQARSPTPNTKETKREKHLTTLTHACLNAADSLKVLQLDLTAEKTLTTVLQ